MNVRRYHLSFWDLLQIETARPNLTTEEYVWALQVIDKTDLNKEPDPFKCHDIKFSILADLFFGKVRDTEV